MKSLSQKLNKFSFLVTLISSPFMAVVYAAIFLPIPLEKQFDGSHALAHGIYKGSESKKLNNDQIYTEFSFELITYIGPNKNRIHNWDNFKVLTPGGNWQGRVEHISGSPKFRKGEEVVLLLSKGKYGPEVHNLKLGVYDINKKNGVKNVVNRIFPNHNLIPSKKLKVFMEEFSMRTKLTSVNRNIRQNTYIDKSKIKKRSPASLDIDKNNSEQESSFWIYLILILMAALGILKKYQDD